MIPDGATFLTGELPFKIPCPPPALRSPPPVHRMSPEIQRKASNPIPSPPVGARVPGDRIQWGPLVFPKSVAHQATASSLETNSESKPNGSLTDRGTSVDASGYASETQVESFESDSIITCEDVALEDFPPMESSEDSRSDSTIGHAMLEIATIEMAAPDAESNSLIQKVKIPSTTEPQRPLICLDDDPVSVAYLAKKLELKTCQVINSLIDIGISSNSGDTFDVKTASQIAERFGFRIETMACEEDPEIRAGG